MTIESRTPTRRRFLELGVAAAGAALMALLARRWRSETKPLAPESLDVIVRAEWGAVEPDVETSDERIPFDPVTNPEGWMVYAEPLEEALTTIIVHHSALPLSDGPREIQQLHMQQKGFADIGYHFLIDAAGRLYEGRSLTVRGAHTGGYNTGTVGIALLGNFEVGQPTPAQSETLKGVVVYLVDLYRITHLAGHRDFQPGVTACPGRNLESLLPGLTTELGLAFGTGGYAGP
jgi:hypothetical protein